VAAKEKRYERELGRNNLGGKTEAEVRELGSRGSKRSKSPRHAAVVDTGCQFVCLLQLVFF